MKGEIEHSTNLAEKPLVIHKLLWRTLHGRAAIRWPCDLQTGLRVTRVVGNHRVNFGIESPSRGRIGCYLFTVSNSCLPSLQRQPVTDTCGFNNSIDF